MLLTDRGDGDAAIDNDAAFISDLWPMVAWLSGRTSVSGRRTFPVLRSTCS